MPELEPEDIQDDVLLDGILDFGEDDLVFAEEEGSPKKENGKDNQNLTDVVPSVQQENPSEKEASPLAAEEAVDPYFKMDVDRVCEKSEDLHAKINFEKYMQKPFPGSTKERAFSHKKKASFGGEKTSQCREKAPLDFFSDRLKKDFQKKINKNSCSNLRKKEGLLFLEKKIKEESLKKEPLKLHMIIKDGNMQKKRLENTKREHDKKKLEEKQKKEYDKKNKSSLLFEKKKIGKVKLEKKLAENVKCSFEEKPKRVCCEKESDRRIFECRKIKPTGLFFEKIVKEERIQNLFSEKKSAPCLTKDLLSTTSIMVVGFGIEEQKKGVKKWKL